MVLKHIGFALIAAGAVVAAVNASGWPRSAWPDQLEVLHLGSQQAAEALGRGGGAACGQASRCDRLTGCIAPSRPPGPVAKRLPKDGTYDRYIRELRAFQTCRQLVLSSKQPRKSLVQLAGLGRPTLGERSFADLVQRWNGQFLWAPASASNNIITRFGDEARAVFGPIPEGDCQDDTAKVIPVEVEGNVVDLKPNPGKAGQPLEFEHRDPAGKVIKWTRSILRCDKPSLAGSVTYCGLNSRLNRVVRGDVEWLFLCRKSTISLEVGNDPYWQRSNPKFALFGTIGFNRITGEIVFFDGRKDREEFDWSKPFVPPGGRSYSDRAGRATAEAIYDPTFQIECYACHDNKNAYVVNPHAGQARVGYFGGRDDPRAIAFSLGDYLPLAPRDQDRPYRVIGSAYTSTYHVELERAKTVRDPTGNCTNCHTLTTQITGKRFAADAVAQEPWISNPTWAQFLELRDEKAKYAHVSLHRTGWALRSGAGKIHPWMNPGNGNELSALPRTMSPADWRKLSDCLWDAGGSECGYRPLYTACPAPGSQGDGSEPSDASVEVLPLPAVETGADRMLRLRWRYLNSYGNVPQRDDVRFDVAVKESAIPPSGEAPKASDYPDMNEARGKDFTAFADEVGVSGFARLIRNVSYFGHAKWTDPTPGTQLRQFRLDLPGTCNRRYLVRILPKRFCFDQSDIAYGASDHVLYADVRCN
jgi:hypothetical protein